MRMAWLVLNENKMKWFGVMGNFDQVDFDNWGAIYFAGFYYIFDSVSSGSSRAFPTHE